MINYDNHEWWLIIIYRDEVRLTHRDHKRDQIWEESGAQTLWYCASFSTDSCCFYHHSLVSSPPSLPSPLPSNMSFIVIAGRHPWASSIMLRHMRPDSCVQRKWSNGLYEHQSTHIYHREWWLEMFGWNSLYEHQSTHVYHREWWLEMFGIIYTYVDVWMK